MRFQYAAHTDTRDSGNAVALIDIVHTEAGGQTVRLPFDCGQVRAGKNLEQNILHQRGDVVLVA